MMEVRTQFISAGPRRNLELCAGKEEDTKKTRAMRHD
jgi:hypothetical protein